MRKLILVAMVTTIISVPAHAQNRGDVFLRHISYLRIMSFIGPKACPNDAGQFHLVGQIANDAQRYAERNGPWTEDYIAEMAAAGEAKFEEIMTNWKKEQFCQKLKHASRNGAGFTTKFLLDAWPGYKPRGIYIGG